MTGPKDLAEWLYNLKMPPCNAKFETENGRMKHHLQIVAQAIQFIEEKVNVLLLDARIGGDIAEKVGQFSQRLVADHQGAAVHHSRFQLGSDLQRTQ